MDGLSSPFPKLCKWNAFTIDRRGGLWKDENETGKYLPLTRGAEGHLWEVDSQPRQGSRY